MFPQKQSPYGNNNLGVQTPKTTEYQIFAKVTQSLRVAADNPNQDRGTTASALHDNRRLWTILATDLASDGNKMGESLKAGLLSIAAFSLSQSSKALKDHGRIASLIEVNMSVMKGLRGEGAQ